MIYLKFKNGKRIIKEVNKDFVLLRIDNLKNKCFIQMKGGFKDGKSTRDFKKC